MECAWTCLDKRVCEKWKDEGMHLSYYIIQYFTALITLAAKRKASGLRVFHFGGVCFQTLFQVHKIKKHPKGAKALRKAYAARLRCTLIAIYIYIVVIESPSLFARNDNGCIYGLALSYDECSMYWRRVEATVSTSKCTSSGRCQHWRV